MRICGVNVPYSKRPQKLFMRICLVKDALRFVANKEDGVGVDFACGTMDNRHLFRASRYIGIDGSKESLEEGIRKWPEAEMLHMTIEETPETVKGDFAICVETIGINSHFNNSNTLKCLSKITESINQDGALLFNIGFDALQQSKEIETFLEKHFTRVTKTKYGTFGGIYSSSLLCSSLGRLLFWVKPLREISHTHTYYACAGRK